VDDLLQGLLLDQLGHVECLERFAVGAIHQPESGNGLGF
jgi:hypothetical protein